MSEPLIFELSVPGRSSHHLPECDVPVRPAEELIPRAFLRKEEPALPELGESDVARHFTRLSRLNYGVDNGFYPLGSCTMKYNPKVSEHAARLPALARLHPYQPPETVQGALAILYHLQQHLAEITGMDAFTLQPAAGAHGELTGMLMIRAYHDHRGDRDRRLVMIPDSAHGTNPATATQCGLRVVQVPSNARGSVDLAALRKVLGLDTAALVLTNPNTLGLLEEEILELAAAVHAAGGLLYYDGANMNAILGRARPGDMGFDVVHLNLHKTFATPHGGGGPGAGPVGVKANLAPFLPRPSVEFNAGKNVYYLDYHRPLSIGRVRSFYGNFGVIVKAYAYILALGATGLKEVAEHAVLNANYLMTLLKDEFPSAYDRFCKHEFVVTPPADLKKNGITTLDLAKRLLDYGYHPPTVYFPLIVKEAIMVEPTETESKVTLDAFARTMKKIAAEGRENPDLLKTAPQNMPITRLDEVGAARKPVLRWKKG